MNLKALQFFRRVADAKSISKVSHESYISQSALSQMMQRLESEIGFQLLERSNKGVSLTDMGKVVYRYSTLINRIVDEMEQELCSVSKSIENIRISGYYSFMNYSLPCVLYKVKKQFDNLNFETFAKSSEDCLKDLTNELTDISFVNIEPEHEKIKYSSIGKERVVLVANKDCNLPDSIKIDDITKYEIVFMNSYSVRKEFIIQKLNEVELNFNDLNIMFEVDNISAAKSSIQNNLGMCFLPYMSIKQELYEEQFKIIEIEDFDLDYQIYVAMIAKCNDLNPVKEVFNYFVDNGTDGIC